MPEEAQSRMTAQQLLQTRESRKRTRPALPSSSSAEPPRKITIHVGEIASSRPPAVIHTLLGSCVAVCLFDPALCAGGMNHIWLPHSRPEVAASRTGVHAMELLINELMGLGCDRRSLVAKAFGGANLFCAKSAPSIGAANIRFVREFLATEKIPLLAERLGGNKAIHLYFDTHTGKAKVKSVRDSALRALKIESAPRSATLRNRFASGDITLF